MSNRVHVWVYILIGAGSWAIWPIILHVLTNYAHIILGIYGADSLKVILDVFPLLLNSPLAWNSLLPYADIVGGGFALLAVLVAILRKPLNRRKRILLSAPVISQYSISHGSL